MVVHHITSSTNAAWLVAVVLATVSEIEQHSIVLLHAMVSIARDVTWEDNR